MEPIANQDIENQSIAPIKELDILWITAGLSCDGDTIAIAAARQPSIEDIVLGAIPGIPKVNFRSPVLASEVGEDFMRYFHLAAEGKLAPFLLVIEGSIPNEKNKTEGYWAAFGLDPKTGQPITTCEWIDRLAPRAWAGTMESEFLRNTMNPFSVLSRDCTAGSTREQASAWPLQDTLWSATTVKSGSSQKLTTGP